MTDNGDNEELRFGFGKNWRRYVACHLDDQAATRATNSLKRLLMLDDLQGRRFLDIGCGSGLFSQAAFRLGADEVFSFDFDPESVACCRTLAERAGAPGNWKVVQGSILDGRFLSGLGQFDIVYSWGVLHHTGDMYRALENAADLVHPGGLLDIAIYNKLEYQSLTKLRGSHYWLRMKRFYNNSGAPVRFMLKSFYQMNEIAKMLVSLKNPVREIRRYSSKRGMSWSVDIVDWIGGYPYQFARVDEIFEFCHCRLGLLLENLKSAGSLGCNEFLFRKPADPSVQADKG